MYFKKRGFDTHREGSETGSQRVEVSRRHCLKAGLVWRATARKAWSPAQVAEVGRGSL